MAGGALAIGAPATALQADLASLAARLRVRYPLLTQLARYAVVGGLGTVVNAVIYLVLRDFLDAVPANLVALVLSTAVSTEVNRRFTFQGAEAHRWRAYVQDGGTVLFYAFYSSLVLVLLDQVIPAATEWEEALAVALASVLGGLLRFLVLRYWVFDTRPEAASAS
ncbi:GtrA family protein [Pseudonocardia acidicola]|uniref:GtrA family protein n=1 Tax=Pseudonocardia acidicola TaxID=2724939 RepID=A0ABX1SMK1_9PSEU|nr:GtrA family protein [Pseudonocardia acidicola]NMI01788.1 GtrA family protein [Pseudonocardia acidicola]